VRADADQALDHRARSPEVAPLVEDTAIRDRHRVEVRDELAPGGGHRFPAPAEDEARDPFELEQEVVAIAHIAVDEVDEGLLALADDRHVEPGELLQRPPWKHRRVGATDHRQALAVHALGQLREVSGTRDLGRGRGESDHVGPEGGDRLLHVLPHVLVGQSQASFAAAVGLEIGRQVSEP